MKRQISSKLVRLTTWVLVWMLFIAPLTPVLAVSPDSGGLSAINGGGLTLNVIYSDIATDPSSVVPGLGGALFESFDKPFGSANGNWILSADTNLATTEDEIILVNDVVKAREGTPALWTTGENVGLIDQRLSINDNGEWVFATNTDGATTTDEYIVKVSATDVFTSVAQEGGAVGAIPGAFWGITLDTPVIASDGSAGLRSSTLTGIPTTVDEAITLENTVFGQEGVTVPTGQIGAEFWDNFDLDGYWISGDGSHWMIQGDLAGDTNFDDVVVVDGAVVVQEGVVLPGTSFAEPVDLNGILDIHMARNGDWYVRGNNDLTEQDWVYSNNGLIATLGDPIYIGATEVFTDAEFTDCFFLHVADSNGNYIIGGVSSGVTNANGVIVLNGTHLVARENDPIDLNGNSIFDDDVFINTFGNDDGYLSDDGMYYFVVTMRNGVGATVGDAFLSVDVSSLIGGGSPEIVVSPNSLSSSQLPDTVITQTLTISNTGTSTLNWNIFEGSILEGGTWSDHFDSYTTGQNLHGVGGWKGWDNNPAATAFTTATQARSSPNSVEIVGSADLVHEYSGITSGQWTFTAWQYLPSALTGATDFILLNTYNDAGPYSWSVVGVFDGATDLVSNPFGASGGTLPIVYDQWVEIRVEIDLDANTQSFYYNDQLLYSGTWTDEVSVGGSLNIGAVDLYADTGSSAYYDDLSLSPAQQPAACDAPGSIPWLETSLSGGSTPPGGSHSTIITFDSASLTPDIYTGTLCISSDDPVTPLVTVPVTLTVEADYGVTLSGDQAASAQPGDTITYTLEVTNTGNTTDTFDLSVTSSWPPDLSDADVTLAAGASTSFWVAVTVPAGTPAGDSDVATVTATSQNDGTATDSASLTSTASIVYGVALSGDQSGGAFPGETVTYTLALTNTGNTTDTFGLSVGSAWPTTQSDASLTLAAGGSTTIWVAVTVPASASDGDSDAATVTATSQNDASATDSATLTTTAGAVYGVDLSGDQAISDSAGNTVTYVLTITNIGNTSDTFDLSAAGVWTATLSSASVTLGAGESVTFTVEVEIPSNASNGDFDVTAVTAISQNDATATDSADLTTTAIVDEPEGYNIYLPLALKSE